MLLIYVPVWERQVQSSLNKIRGKKIIKNTNILADHLKVHTAQPSFLEHTPTPMADHKNLKKGQVKTGLLETSAPPSPWWFQVLPLKMRPVRRPCLQQTLLLLLMSAAHPLTPPAALVSDPSFSSLVSPRRGAISLCFLCGCDIQESVR